MSGGRVVLVVAALAFVSCGDEAKVLEGPPQPDISEEEDRDDRDDRDEVEQDPGRQASGKNENPTEGQDQEGGQAAAEGAGGTGGSGATSGDRAAGGKDGERADRDAGVPKDAGAK